RDITIPRINNSWTWLVGGQSRAVMQYNLEDQSPPWVQSVLGHLGLYGYSPWRPRHFVGLFDWSANEWLVQWAQPEDATVECDVSQDGSHLLVAYRFRTDETRTLHLRLYDLNYHPFSRWWARGAAGLVFLAALPILFVRR